MKLACLLFVFLLPVSLRAGVDGSPQAIQSAINSASNGATIQVNSGTFTWTSGITVRKFVKLQGSNTKIVSNSSSPLIIIAPQSAGSVEISGFTIERGSGTGASLLTCEDASGKPPLIHDCTVSTKGGGDSFEWRHNGGVIYNCKFVSADRSDSSAIKLKNPSSDSAWREVDYMGMDDANGDKNTYIEDCRFEDLFLQAMDFDDNSRTVVRYCTLKDSAIASHGQETSAVGGRQYELYENEFIFTPGGSPPNPYPLNLNYWFFIRTGGAATIFNNKIPPISSQWWGNKPGLKFNLYNIRRRGQIPCQTSYPAARQIGFGSDTSGRLVSSPVYIWGNTGGGNYDNPAIEDYNPDECGNGLHTADFVKKGRDFFTGTQKPGYTPYTYPHPLRSGGPGPTPTPSPTVTPPPPTPTPTPTPTATPSPTPTATPTPPAEQSYSQWYDELARWILAHPPTPNK